FAQPLPSAASPPAGRGDAAARQRGAGAGLRDPDAGRGGGWSAPAGLRGARPSGTAAACLRRLKGNTVEIGASHGLLLSWVWEPTRYQGGCDYDATRTMHA